MAQSVRLSNAIMVPGWSKHRTHSSVKAVPMVHLGTCPYGASHSAFHKPCRSKHHTYSSVEAVQVVHLESCPMWHISFCFSPLCRSIPDMGKALRHSIPSPTDSFSALLHRRSPKKPIVMVLDMAEYCPLWALPHRSKPTWSALPPLTPPWGLSALAEVCPTTGQRDEVSALIPIVMVLDMAEYCPLWGIPRVTSHGFVLYGEYPQSDRFVPPSWFPFAWSGASDDEEEEDQIIMGTSEDEYQEEEEEKEEEADDDEDT
ncbi:hypothetical protein JCGZ_23729 [Jatropha curcas]|uniref:Uncharacterized protein n=1 Tax=Jatropha curcas TaxID=180498 RepID=A0A067K252_JATCU|nr:hypothetical protein JCGZ_23729 [Jatropha curcas]